MKFIKKHLHNILNIGLGIIFLATALYTNISHATQVPEAPHTEVDHMTPKEALIANNSLCAGYYNAMSVGEMGSVESLVGLWVKNDTSSAQKLAVRLFTEHSNAYKRMGAMRSDAYDLGGQIGGQIFMGGVWRDGDDYMTKATAEEYCAKTRKGIIP